MLDVFDIAGLIHFGISGNVNSSLEIGDVVIPNQFANTGLWDWLVTTAANTWVESYFLFCVGRLKFQNGKPIMRRISILLLHFSILICLFSVFQKPNAAVPSNDFGSLEFKNYNEPQEGSNSLGSVAYSPEEFYSEAGEANVAQRPVWFNVTKSWLQHASSLEVSIVIKPLHSSMN